MGNTVFNQMGNSPSKKELYHTEYMERQKREFHREEYKHREIMKAIDAKQREVEAYAKVVTTAEVYTHNGDIYKGIPALKYAVGEEKAFKMLQGYSSAINRASGAGMITDVNDY